MTKVISRIGKLVGSILLLCTAASVPSAALADSYPESPVRIVVPYAAGGGGDVVGRPLAKVLSERLGKGVFIDNRAGANGNIGMDMVSRAPNDGYTLVLALTSQLAINPSLYEKLAYDPAKSFEPIALLASAPYFLVVHPSVPAKNLAEFIKLAKANPGKYTFGSSGIGSGPHLSMELLKSMARIDLMHVPYKGAGQAFPALLAGDIKVMFASYGLAAQQIKAGKLRVLAVSTAHRAASMPDVPTIAEAGLPGYESDVWYALLAPHGTPRAIVDRLNSEVSVALKSTEMREHFRVDGISPLGSTPEQLAAYIKTENRKWSEVVKRSGAKNE